MTAFTGVLRDDACVVMRNRGGGKNATFSATVIKFEPCCWFHLSPSVLRSYLSLYHGAADSRFSWAGGGGGSRRVLLKGAGVWNFFQVGLRPLDPSVTYRIHVVLVLTCGFQISDPGPKVWTFVLGCKPLGTLVTSRGRDRP